MFQSPLHRGLGSDDDPERQERHRDKFQSPLHRGLGSDFETIPERRGNDVEVSIPSSSGPGFGHQEAIRESAWSVSFNPLFIGAWVRTQMPVLILTWSCCFNPLFIGAWVRTVVLIINDLVRGAEFQSPLHRGLGSDGNSPPAPNGRVSCFNPLFIGAWVRTAVDTNNVWGWAQVSIPSSSGPGFGHSCGRRPRLPVPHVSIPSSSGPGFGR